MNKCKVCKQEIIDSDLVDDLASQADALGMESLTEDQQMLVNGYMCEECYMELN